MFVRSLLLFTQCGGCCHFYLAWTKSRKSYCTTPASALASASSLAKVFTLKFLCDGQGSVRRAILSL